MTTEVAYPLRITVGGLKLYTRAIAPVELSNIDDLPDFRGEDMPLAGRHGRQFLDKLRDQRVWHMRLLVLADDDTGMQTGTAAAQVRANLDALLAVLGASGQQLVQRKMPDNSTRWCYAETTVENTSDLVGDEGLIQLTATFIMADPRWYGDNVTHTETFGSTPKTFSMTVPGTLPTPRVSIDDTGPNTGLRVTNNTTGQWVEYTSGVVASAKHLLLDSYAWTAANDGTDVQAALTHAQSSVPFLEAAPGANSITISASSAGGSVLVTITPAYW